MCCSTSTDRNMLTVSCKANSVQATNNLVTSPLKTAYVHIKLTCVLPEFYSFPTETKKRTIAACLAVSLDKLLGPKAPMTRNTGPPKQSKHQHAFCSSQEYSWENIQSFTYSLDSFSCSAPEGQWMRLHHISLSTATQGIQLPAHLQSASH